MKNPFTSESHTALYIGIGAAAVVAAAAYLLLTEDGNKRCNKIK
jgi:hypothetical protein